MRCAPELWGWVGRTRSLPPACSCPVPPGATRSSPSLCRGGGARARGALWHGLAGGRSRAGLSLSAATAHRTTWLEPGAFFFLHTPPLVPHRAAVPQRPPAVPHKQSSSLAQLSTSGCLPAAGAPKAMFVGENGACCLPKCLAALWHSCRAVPG